METTTPRPASPNQNPLVALDFASASAMRESAKSLLTQLAHDPKLAAREYTALQRAAERLAAGQMHGLARQLLAWARFGAPVTNVSLARRLGQRHALFTAKDSDLPVEMRLARARAILESVDDVATTNDSETLAILGSLSKQLWEIDGRTEHLADSLSAYRRGFLASAGPAASPTGVLSDGGYNGINAAFILDLMAAQEDRHPRGVRDAAGNLRNEADSIRRQVMEALRPQIAPLLDASGLAAYLISSDEALGKWWIVVTFAEAALGLGEAKQAAAALEAAAPMRRHVTGWAIETTIRQLLAVVRLRYPEDQREPAFAAIRAIAGNSLLMHDIASPKVGLALSGGGFRASFFHIGVLAWLAERGVLNSVEVVSCVSGGSIVGAHYYLLVKQLLESKNDSEVKAEDYIRLVRALHDQFLRGVQTNLRTRLLAELSTSIRMVFQPHFTRTRRLGQLYEEYLYATVDKGATRRRRMDSLFVMPQGEPDFSPRRDNWQRRSKVPILVLNATTLNTGHNWQFTASWMGEPPAAIDEEVDSNDRLRRMYYRDAPGRYVKRGIGLGTAVAASSCVPGLFEPIVFTELYPDRAIALVDGGVHDNQGVASLLEQDCRVLLVSDASGQMRSAAGARGDPAGVFQRVNDVLMARVRGSQYRELATRKRASLAHGLMFLHLRKGLDGERVDWLNSKEPVDPDDPRTWSSSSDETPYGVARQLQAHLAAMRTDLDSFSEVEASALMLSGYRMAAHEFEKCLPGFARMTEKTQAESWPFLQLAPLMKSLPADDPAAKAMERRLRVSRHQFLKVWQIGGVGPVVTMGLGLAGLVGATIVYRALVAPVLSSVVTVLSAAVAASLVWGVVRVAWFAEPVSQVATGIGMGWLGIVMWPINRFHLHVADRFFLRNGRIASVLALRHTRSAPANQASLAR